MHPLSKILVDLFVLAVLLNWTNWEKAKEDLLAARKNWRDAIRIRQEARKIKDEIKSLRARSR